MIVLPKIDERLDFITNKNILALQQVVCKSVSRVNHLEGKFEAISRIGSSGSDSNLQSNDKGCQHCPKTSSEAKKLLEDSKPITLSAVQSMFDQGKRFLASEISDSISLLAGNLSATNPKPQNKLVPRGGKPYSNKGKQNQNKKFQKSGK